MFISVMYKDVPELSQTGIRSSDPDLSMEKILLVNPDCPVRIMLEYIRKICRLGVYTQFDLCEENGCLKGLFNYPTYAPATDLFDHKRTYFIIVLKNVDSDKNLTVIPQLNRENQLFKVLQAKVRQFIQVGSVESPVASVAKGSAKGTAGAKPGKTSPPSVGKAPGKTSPQNASKPGGKATTGKTTPK